MTNTAKMMLPPPLHATPYPATLVAVPRTQALPRNPDDVPYVPRSDRPTTKPAKKVAA